VSYAVHKPESIVALWLIPLEQLDDRGSTGQKSCIGFIELMYHSSIAVKLLIICL